MKYVPILQYRGAEIAALKKFRNFRVSKPLIELVRAPEGSSYKQDLAHCTFEFFCDIPMHIKINNSTLPEVMSFLSDPIDNINKRLAIFQSMGLVKNLTPVISYKPKAFIPGSLKQQKQFLSGLGYKSFAYRIYIDDFTAALQEISSIITKEDTILFDTDHENLKKLNSNCLTINQIKNKTGCKTVAIQSMIPKTLANKDYRHKQIEKRVDTSIRYLHRVKGFDAFGDYCGIKKNNLKKAQGISPAFLFYSFDNNHFIGFKGTFGKVRTFKSIIAPAILNHTVWKEYTQTLIDSCPGRQYIISVNNNPDHTKSGSQVTWKTAAICHYLHTMDSLL